MFWKWDWCWLISKQVNTRDVCRSCTCHNIFISVPRYNNIDHFLQIRYINERYRYQNATPVVHVNAFDKYCICSSFIQEISLKNSTFEISFIKSLSYTRDSTQIKFLSMDLTRVWGNRGRNLREEKTPFIVFLMVMGLTR